MMMMPSPGRLALGAILILAVAAVGPASAAGTRTVLKPTHKPPLVKITDGDSPHLYYQAEKAKPVEYLVQGPLTLRVFGRSLVVAGPKFDLEAEVDGATVRAIALKGTAARRATREGGIRVGVLSRVLVKVAAGPHRLSLQPATDGVSAAVRVLPGVGRKGARAWVSFAPEIFDRAVRLQGRDVETTWYRFGNGHPVGLTLHGPLHLKVASRIDFGSTSGVTEAYVIKVTLDGKPLAGFALKSRASSTVTCADMGEITPGMVKEFALKIPAGLHRLSLSLDGTTAGGAALQILVPKKELQPHRVKARGKGKAELIWSGARR